MMKLYRLLCMRNLGAVRLLSAYCLRALAFVAKASQQRRTNTERAKPIAWQITSEGRSR